MTARTMGNEMLNASFDITTEKNTKAVRVFLFGAVCAFGLLANGILFVALLRRRTLLKHPLYMCMIVFGVVDSLTLLTIPFVAHHEAAASWTFGNILCQIFLVEVTFGSYGKVVMVLIMAATMIHITRMLPGNYAGSPKITLIACLVMCLVALSLAVPVGVLSGVKQNGNEYYCYIGWDINYVAGRVYTFVLQVASTLAVLITLIVKTVYCCIRWEHLRNSHGHGKAAVMVIVILVIEILLMLVYVVSTVLIQKRVVHNGMVVNIIISTYAIISYATCLIRPVLYACFCRPIRRSMRHVITLGHLRDDKENGEEFPLLTEKKAEQ